MKTKNQLLQDIRKGQLQTIQEYEGTRKLPHTHASNQHGHRSKIPPPLRVGHPGQALMLIK